MAQSATRWAKWKHLVHKAGLHASLQRQKHAEWYDWNRAILDMLKEHDLWESTEQVPWTGYHACLRCRQRFNTKAAWSVHAFKIHQRVTKVRKVADGVECRICLKRYHSHDRLINHLKYSTKCYKEHRRRLLFAENQPAANSVEVKRRTGEGALPVLSAHGPVQPSVEEEHRFLDDIDRGEQDTVEELITLFEELGNAPIGLEEAVQAVHHTFYRSCAYAPRLLTVFCLTLDEYIDSGMAADEQAANYLKDLRAAIYSRWCGSWILSGLPCTKERHKTGHGWLDTDAEFVKLQRRQTAPRVSRPLKLRQLIFLHLFSGHRREGDLQQAVEQMGRNGERETMALSVDIIISEEFGNLLQPSTFNLFLQAIYAGWVAGVAAGPPCETWSIARERFYVERCGPRPLRDVHHLSGYNVLRLKELRQILIGNQLLGVAIRLFVAAWLCGCFFVLEHPEEPEAEWSASIWRLPCLRWLQSLPGVARHIFLQGLFGAPSAKPTHLLFSHPPANVRSLFKQCQVVDHVPKASSIGRGQDGQFLTSRLKVYPPQFCRAIALSWWSHVKERPKAAVHEDARNVQLKSFHDAIRSMHQEISDCGDKGRHGPDYHPVAAQCM